MVPLDLLPRIPPPTGEMQYSSSRALQRLSASKLPLRTPTAAHVHNSASLRKLSASTPLRAPHWRASPALWLYQRHILLNPSLRPHSRNLFGTPFKDRTPLFRAVYRTFAYAGAFGLTITGLVLAFFLYDASTYREDLTFCEVTVPDLALNPRRGGAKNLPILENTLDEDDSDEMRRLREKPRLVILGSGWGSVAMLKTLNPEDWNVTVVSETNYFLFTPMLPSATVGTLELRSLLEPMRRIVQRVRGHFLKGSAVSIDFAERLVEVSQTDADGKERRFYLPYDKLVIGVGMEALFCGVGSGD